MQVARLHAWDGVRVQQPCSNPGEQRRTSTRTCKREYAYLQGFLNNSEQPRPYESALARRRSGVRIPSAPLLKYADLQVKLGIVKEVLRRDRRLGKDYERKIQT